MLEERTFLGLQLDWLMVRNEGYEGGREKSKGYRSVQENKGHHKVIRTVSPVE